MSTSADNQSLFSENKEPLALWLIIAIPIACMAVLFASAQIFTALIPHNAEIVSMLELVPPLIVIIGVYFGYARISLLTQSPVARKSVWVWGVLFIFLGPVGWWFSFSDLASGATVFRGFMPLLIYTITMILVGFFEELTYRGFLFGALLHAGLRQHNTYYYSSVWGAVLGSALLFGIAHIVNYINTDAPLYVAVTQMVYAGMLGIFLAALYYRGRSLWWGALVHALFDFLSQFSSLTQVPGKVSEAATYPSFNDSMVTIALFLPWAIIGAVMIHRDIVRNQKRLNTY